MMHDILIGRSSNEKIRIVDISCNWNEKLKSYVISRCTSQLNGKVVNQPVIEISKGKVKRSITEQAQLEYNSHVKKYLDKGYKNLKDFGFDTITGNESQIEILLPKVKIDTNGFVKPMLAKLIDPKSEIYNNKFLASRKLDGVRAMMKWENDEIITASRGGMDYNIPTTYIRNVIDLQDFLKKTDIVLDGELYIHGKQLSYISGIVRKMELEESHNELEYWIYDIVDLNKTFIERLEILNEMKELFKDHEKIKIVNHIPISGKDNIMKQHDLWIGEGFEGLVLREPDSKYIPGNRSMIKVKEFQDAEFEILGLAEGLREEDFVFKLKGDNGIFEAKPEGDRAIKRYYRSKINDIIGKMGTVRYFGLTKNGLPNIPVFVKIREYDE